MSGIFLAAILTTLVALAVFGGVIFRLRLRQPADPLLPGLAFLLVLPLQPLVFYSVRLPLDHWIAAHLGIKSMACQWVTTFYAPLTEEPAKLLPLLIPAIRRNIRSENFVRYALVIGLGFAIGEMWFVAERISQYPPFASLPFYQLGGYATERLMTCVFHSTFVAIALWRLRRGFVFGFVGAVAAHWLCNFPITLMNWNVGGLGRTIWGGILFYWLLALFLASCAILSWFTFGRTSPGRLFFGRRKCSECGCEFDPKFFLGLNFGSRRFEPCPGCHRWRWTVSAAQQHQSAQD